MNHLCNTKVKNAPEHGEIMRDIHELLQKLRFPVVLNHSQPSSSPWQLQVPTITTYFQTENIDGTREKVSVHRGWATVFIEVLLMRSDVQQNHQQLYMHACNSNQAEILRILSTPFHGAETRVQYTDIVHGK